MLRFGTVLCLLLVWGLATAERITIRTNPDAPSQLELRNLTLPDGSEVQYYVIRGQPVVIDIDGEEELEAEHVEIDLTNRLLRVIGYGIFRGAEETIAGDDLIVELDDETFSGRDVLIVTEAIDVLGVDASRVPGQIDVTSGRFSPCSRCEQQIQDYSFRAARLELYPGDRLVAFEVTVLIRELPVFFLPVLVVPLAPPDRQPRLSISQGTASERAEVALDWPYVAGGAALGTFSLRYYADIVPGAGNLFTNGLLGGRTRESYLGGGIDHRFFTDTGAGRFEFFYQPSFIQYGSGLEPSGKTRDQFRLRFRYDTAEELSDLPRVSLLLERDDERLQRILEYDLRLENAAGGLEGAFSSQGFIDLEPDEGPSGPSYGEPQRTLARLELRPQAERFSVGPFSLSNLLFDLGVFEGRAAPSAQRFGVISALRLLERHSLTLEPVQPWSGLELSGRSDFQGQYYSGGQRLIDWDSELNLRQNFGIGSISLRFDRDINEGETPFRFDGIGLGNAVSLFGDLELTPFPWLRFTSSERYTFVDERRPDLEGPGPLQSRLSLFGNLNWLSLDFETTYDIKDADPGTLVSSLTLRAPEPRLDASLTYRYIQDLQVEPNRVGGGLIDETATEAELRFGLRPYFDLSLSGGYTFEPPLPEEPGGIRDFWQPLELTAVFGTLDQNDSAPGLQLSYERDLNRREPRSFSVDASAALPPFEISLSQTFDFEDERIDNASFGVRWRGVAILEARGLPLLPARVVGLELDPEAAQNYSVNLFEDRPDGGTPRWRLSYTTVRDPTFTNRDGGEGLYRNSRLEALVNLQEGQFGSVYYQLDLSANLLLADDQQPLTYLANTDLDFFVDVASTVGLQATLRYNAALNAEQDGIGRATLDLEDVAATVKLFDQLYLSAILERETWTLSSPTPVDGAFNFQPIFQVVWDRCCWALYGRWNTQTGAISITLTTPGADSGFRQAFDTPLTLPGRGGAP